MSQSKKKNAVESAQAWMTKHQSENLDLKTLKAALTAVTKKSAEAQAAATQLGEILIARKEAQTLLKKALKDAKAARKATPAPAPVKAPAKAPARKVAAKKAAPKAAPKASGN